MDSLLRRRPRHATVVAYLALFVALGGSSYAALRVGSAQIVNNSILSKDIRNNQVTSRDLRNNSARGRDVRDDTLTGDDILESSLGQVPNAASADNAKNATNATNANTAANANALGGVAPSAYLRSGERVTESNTALVSDYADNANLVTVNVPAGQYAVVAHNEVFNDTNAAEDITCTLRVNGGIRDTSRAILGPDATGGADTAERLPYAFAESFTTDTASALTLNCEQAGGDNDAANNRIIAMKLD